MKHKIAEHKSIDQRSVDILRLCKGFIKRADNILDIGSGTGWVAFHLQNYFRARVRCVDIVNEHSTPLPFTVYNGKRLLFGANRFDVVLLIYTLHHCEDPLNVLQEAQRVSKDKIIIFEDIYTNWLNKIVAKIWDYYINMKYNPKVRTPFNFKKEEAWKTIFKTLGLTVIRTKHIPGHWRYPVRHVQFVLEK